MENDGYGEIPQNANEHCPGTQSELAGKSDACQGYPNQQVCAIAPKGPDPDGLIRRCVPESKYDQILFHFHDSKVGGHVGPNRTAKKVCASRGESLEKAGKCIALRNGETSKKIKFPDSPRSVVASSGTEPLQRKNRVLPKAPWPAVLTTTTVAIPGPRNLLLLTRPWQ